jgi:adenylate kinase
MSNEETGMKLKQTYKKLFLTIAILSIAAPGISTAQSEDGQYIVIVGAPTAGKSTNSKWISKTYVIPWLNIGELVEAEVVAASKSRKSASMQHKRGAASNQRYQNSRKALEKLKNGELISNGSLNAIVASEVLSYEAKDGFILDGYPMTVPQAEFLDSILDARGISPLKVIYLNIPDELSLERMKERGRADYKRGFGEERLRQFRSMIGPLVEYYGEESVHEIDATQSKSEIMAEINTVLLKKAAPD